LTPYSFRCDLARFCLLYAFGGLYADLGVRFVRPFLPPAGVGLAGFRDYWLSATHSPAMSTSIIHAAPGRPEMRTAIDLIVENCRRHRYGATPLDPTGPGVLGRAVAIADAAESSWFGDYRAITPEFPRKNLAFVTPDGELVALGKNEPGGSLDALGLTGTNNYIDIWRSRQAYGERERRWRFDDPEIRIGVGERGPDGVAFRTGARGHVFYGPYALTLSGRHRVALTFGEQTRLADAALDVSAHGGADIVARADDVRLDERGRATLEFTTTTALPELEIRLHVDGASSGRFIELEIVRL
jgi:hypothetical protein